MHYTNAEEFAEQYELQYRYGKYQGNCPVCGYQGFSLYDTGDKLLFKAHACGCSQADVIRQFQEDGLWAGGSESSRMYRPYENDLFQTRSQKAMAYANRLWEQSQNAQGMLVETYLRTRGYSGKVPALIRYLPQTRHTLSGLTFPAMLAGVRLWPSQDIVAVHRTYLAPDGRTKADVDPNKMSLGSIGGGSIQLTSTGPNLALTEGIETALSILEATDMPTWAALSAGGLCQLILPALPLASQIIICADHDPVGLAAAKQAAYRWGQEGRQVRIAKPLQLGSDFNDALNQ